MKGVYRASIKISGLSTAKTILYITAPATKTIELLSAQIDNATVETNEQLEAVWQKVTTLGTPTATTITPSKTEEGDQAATSTVKGNVTASEPTYGAESSGVYPDSHGRKGFASLAGYDFQPTPEERFYIPPSGTYGLRMISTPTAFDCIVTATFREIG